jgi:hypothetical protein
MYPGGPLSSVLEPAKHELLLIDVSLKAHGPFIQRPNPAGGLSLGVTPRHLHCSSLVAGGGAEKFGERWRTPEA